MRAAHFDGDGAVSIGERPDPAAGPGHAVLEVAWCAFCGSDKRLLRSGTSRVPGHEIVGRVVDPGDGPAARVGQAAAVYAPLYCGHCAWCRRGATNRCAEMSGVIGWQVDGGFAERVRVPHRNLLPVPDDVPVGRAVLVLDTLGTAAHGLDRACAAVDGATGPVLVLGCGPLGLGVVAVARHRNQTVLAFDVSPARLEAAVALGARAWDGVADESTDRGATGGFAVVVEASGAPDARRLADAAVDQGGAVLMLSEGDAPWSLPATVHWRRTEAAWVRSFYFPVGDTAANWQLVRDVGGTLEEVLVSYEPFADLPRVARAFLEGRSIKPVVGLGGR